ncbi:SDR family NAD(P)-dependent oxidoreductase, partial [Vibrio metschnikovii]|nr:SDR family NAD(P)-dependent oxidoreductase [Vibrio metschnikovii]
MNILVTGGTGYIGSHTCIQLIQAGITPIILDNLYNSKKLVLERIAQVTGVTPQFYQGDIGDSELLERIFAQHEIASVVHFAGLKAVGESVEKPLMYYQNNVAGTLNLVQAMDKARVKSLI